jgi:RND family efflux transporter MFP subunit
MMRPLVRATNFLIATALLLPALGCGARHGEAPPENRATVVTETRVAALDEVPRAVHTTGSIRPWARVSPGTKILGRVEEFTVREGDRVRRGQVLVRLERRDLEAAVEQARAAIAMAEAELDRTGAQHDRMRSLQARGSVTDKNLEDAVAGFRVAEAALQQAQANLSAAEVTLGYAEIRSPVDGFVTARRVESGDMASPGAALLVVEDLARVKVILTVPESDVVSLAPGAPARVSVDVLESSWDATVDRVNPAGDPASRTFDVEVVLDNADGRLKSGMFARATFARGTREALLVPAGAVVQRGALEGLFVLDGERRARLRWIRTGRALDDRIEVLSGLEPGERFVVDPPLALSDGTTVAER